jgi:hypothetical protein
VAGIGTPSVGLRGLLIREFNNVEMRRNRRCRRRVVEAIGARRIGHLVGQRRPLVLAGGECLDHEVAIIRWILQIQFRVAIRADRDDQDVERHYGDRRRVSLDWALPERFGRSNATLIKGVRGDPTLAGHQLHIEVFGDCVRFRTRVRPFPCTSCAPSSLETYRGGHRHADRRLHGPEPPCAGDSNRVANRCGG